MVVTVGVGNVLISSAGRRVGLVRIAREAASRVGGRVIAVDVEPELSAACHLADEAYAVPANTSPDLLPRLNEIAQQCEVALIIPTLDTELLSLAGVRDDWRRRGVHVAVPDRSFVSLCRDKRRTTELFATFGIPSPTVISDDVTFPRFVKPTSGSMSEDTHIVLNGDAFERRWADSSRYIQQEYLDPEHYGEYTVDLLYSISGSLVCAIPRHRLEVRGGEISKGRTEKYPLLAYLRERMADVPGAWGCLTAQFFVAHQWHDAASPVFGIEVNPRIGGGYPLTDRAGGHYLEWLLVEVLEGTSKPYTDNWRDGMTMLRFDEAVYF